jgi:isochorismate hydrolase
MVGIPVIDPYPMPTAGDLPANVAGWAVDPARGVLLIHDMQSFFLDPLPEGMSPRNELVPNVALLRRRCAGWGMPVAYTAQPGGMTDAQRGLLKDFWGPGMRVAPEDRQIVREVAPAADDWMLTKWRYSAFHGSDLLARMRERGRDQLVICGVYAHVGVLMTAVDAFSNDVQVFLGADAVADFSAEYHRLAITYAAQRCAVVATTAQILAQLGRPTAAAAGVVLSGATT